MCLFVCFRQEWAAVKEWSEVHRIPTRASTANKRPLWSHSCSGKSQINRTWWAANSSSSSTIVPGNNIKMCATRSFEHESSFIRANGQQSTNKFYHWYRILFSIFLLLTTRIRRTNFQFSLLTHIGLGDHIFFFYVRLRIIYLCAFAWHAANLRRFT